MHVTCAVCATWHFRYNVVTESVVELDRLDETLYLDFRKRDTQAPYPRGVYPVSRISHRLAHSIEEEHQFCSNEAVGRVRWAEA